MINWPKLNLQPVNLYSLPDHLKRVGCLHSHWMLLHSKKKKICYDCGKEQEINNDMPIHQR